MLALLSGISTCVQSQSIGLSFYSTYPSESLAIQCNENEKVLPTSLNCTEDFVAPDFYIAALTHLDAFTQVAAYTSGNDYEILVANLSRTEGDIQHFSEFTLQWRGIEIDSFTTTNQHNTSEAIASTAVNDWLAHAVSRSIFSASHLYGSIGASDYISALKLPNTIQQFQRTDTLLYPDPFKGAVTRYVHNEYEDAIVDVSVFPFMAQTQHPSNSLLIGELQNDQQIALAVAQQEDLQLLSETPISPFSALNGNNGFKLHMVANGQNEEPIYATSYAFFAKDKVIKVSTTFPENLSDEFANVLMASIEVPDESRLMSEVRLLLLEAESN